MHPNVAEENMFKAELLFSLNCYAQNRIKDVLNHVKLRLMWRSNSKRMINNDWAIVLYSGKIQGMKVWLHMYVRLFIGC
jgi:hypothetical protein